MIHSIIFGIVVSLLISWWCYCFERYRKEEDKRREEQLKRILREERERK